MPPLQNCIGLTFCISREILCLPYAGFVYGFPKSLKEITICTYIYIRVVGIKASAWSLSALNNFSDTQIYLLCCNKNTKPSLFVKVQCKNVV